VKELKSLNPGLKRWCTPPATREHPYTLRLPRGTAPLFAENFAKLPKRQRLTFRIHRVKSGDTLSAIALAYGTKTEAIMSMNHLKSARRLRLHSDLVIPVPRQGPAPEVVVAKTSPGDARPEVSKVVLAKALAQARAAKPVPAHLVAAPPRGKLHASGEVRSESVAGRTRLHYAVREGDTLWSISQRFGCSVADLRKWNHLGRRATLKIGRSLVLWPKAHVVSSRKTRHPWVAQQ
jgi:membrane-bound lytic murein transglycosylase D